MLHDVELMLLQPRAGEPALLVMPQSGNDETAFLDFVAQHRPEETYATGSLSLGSLEAMLAVVKVVGGGTPCEASEALARKFWSQASELVVARCDRRLYLCAHSCPSGCQEVVAAGPAQPDGGSGELGWGSQAAGPALRGLGFGPRRIGPVADSIAECTGRLRCTGEA